MGLESESASTTSDKDVDSEGPVVTSSEICFNKSQICDPIGRERWLSRQGAWKAWEHGKR
eukprot:CAMPEP_0196591846 /NCGR_PEP_ID=MMETSP1081-20130531/71089_1 /TAXON_ID=36882 /ORGANISM="Pyramimonas amylifera, Strain CCMP720" /LENGTH=59 /DNA_ID=CAMNT_0041915355 /DNA_START=174 /DNA_END=353 /DNA_ORIENTATION=+